MCFIKYFLKNSISFDIWNIQNLRNENIYFLCLFYEEKMGWNTEFILNA